MKIEQFDLKDLPVTSGLIRDYILQKESLIQLVQSTPTLDYIKQAVDRRKSYPIDRNALSDQIKRNYRGQELSPQLAENIELLKKENTFTVCTAHQPALFTGPLYVVIKALSTIALSRRLTRELAGIQVVPIFILGSEDHDFDEINHLNVYGKKVEWEHPLSAGPVGLLSTDGIDTALNELKTILGDSDQAGEIVNELYNSFHEHCSNYGEGTQNYLNALFSHLGLIVTNVSGPYFKSKFSSIVTEELVQQQSHEIVKSQISKLESLGYKKQAHPREINLFYIKPGLRERITKEGDVYKVNRTDIEFTREQIFNELKEHPERFSPNVILRPLLQEMSLPNLAYVGGGGELAYWMQLRPLFEHFDVPYPCLLRRDSLLWVSAGHQKKINKLNLDVQQLFKDKQDLINSFIQEHSSENGIKLSEFKQELSSVFNNIKSKVTEVDPTLGATVMAEMKNTMKGISGLESKMSKAIKLRHEVELNQLVKLKDQLFPNNKLQERVDNFLPIYLKHGKEMFDVLLDQFDPLNAKLTVVLEGG